MEFAGRWRQAGGFFFAEYQNQELEAQRALKTLRRLLRSTGGRYI
jgi:hypothetical protein